MVGRVDGSRDWGVDRNATGLKRRDAREGECVRRLESENDDSADCRHHGAKEK